MSSDQITSGYQTKFETVVIGDSNYRLQLLHDRQQYSDPLGAAAAAGVPPASWPLFGQIWPAGIILADFIDRMEQHCLDGVRILEIGCGLGLASLVACRRGADITACDYHPLAQQFLKNNAQLNGFPEIPFVISDWSQANSLLGTFDLIIGSDVLYEPNQPALLADFIHRHARIDAAAIIIDPNRGNQAKLNRAMQTFGYSCVSEKIKTPLALNLQFTGHMLTYRHAGATR